MSADLAYVAGSGASVCYGLATVLEQIAARKETRIKKANPSVLLKLLKQIPYLEGIALDIIGLLLVLYAVRILPLFLVQSFVASSLIVSALVDYYWLKSEITGREKLSIVMVLIGIIVLGVVAHPGTSKPISQVYEWIVIAGAPALFMVSFAVMKAKASHAASITLSVVAGLAFGATSLIARIINYHHLDLYSKTGLLVIALIIYGLLGMTMLTVALQRENINHVNSALYSSEVMIPSILGIIFLGDKVNSGQDWLLYAGLLFVIIGASLIALEQKPVLLHPKSTPHEI